MDFTFDTHFQPSEDYLEVDLNLNTKLQETRESLQESLSEIEQLVSLINTLYDEARIENVAVSELLSQIPKPLFRNIPLPRNADGLSISEKAGYAVYCLKFLGYATRKAAEDYHNTKDHLESMHKSVRGNTTEKIDIVRTGSIRVPELDGQKELKRNNETTDAAISKGEKPRKLETNEITPPATPPKEEKEKKTKDESSSRRRKQEKA